MAGGLQGGGAAEVRRLTQGVKGQRGPAGAYKGYGSGTDSVDGTPTSQPQGQGDRGHREAEIQRRSGWGRRQFDIRESRIRHRVYMKDYMASRVRYSIMIARRRYDSRQALHLHPQVRPGNPLPTQRPIQGVRPLLLLHHPALNPVEAVPQDPLRPFRNGTCRVVGSLQRVRPKQNSPYTPFCGPKSEGLDSEYHQEGQSRQAPSSRKCGGHRDAL